MHRAAPRPVRTQRIRRALTAITLAIAVAAGLPLATSQSSAPAAAAEVTKPAGMVTDLTWYISRAEMDRSIAMMRDAGVKWVRANVNWRSAEPDAKGVLDPYWLDMTDYAVRAAHAAGIQVLMPIADGVPYWASGDPAKYVDASGGRHWNHYWKPSSFTLYADFVRTIVTRYKDLGVHTYEVWNEPNYVRFWPSGPSATDYTAMLRATYPAIKQADPAARVVLGGLSLSDYGFLQQLYSAGAAPYFDIAAVHPYTGSVDPSQCWYQSGTTKYAKEAFCGIAEVRKTMLANGDSSELWLTELGWATAPVPNGVTEATQASYLTKAFNQLASYPYVTNAFWYSGRNNYWSGNDQTDLEANYGLVKVDFTPKPSLAAYKAYATAGTTATTLAPTTTVAPTTTIAPTTTVTTAPTTTTTAPPTTPSDVTAPLLSAPTASSVTSRAATITWTSNEPATSTVTYWVRGSTSKRTATVAGYVQSHRVVLSGLKRRTTYEYTVTSRDAAGNARVSPTSSFTTRL